MALSTKRPQQLLITSTQFQIAGTLHRSLLKQCKKQKASQIRQMNVNGVVCNNFLFDHQHLEAASVHGGTHPCLHKLSLSGESVDWLDTRLHLVEFHAPSPKSSQSTILLMDMCSSSRIACVTTLHLDASTKTCVAKP